MDYCACVPSTQTALWLHAGRAPNPMMAAGKYLRHIRTSYESPPHSQYRLGNSAFSSTPLFSNVDISGSCSATVRTSARKRHETWRRSASSSEWSNDGGRSTIFSAGFKNETLFPNATNLTTSHIITLKVDCSSSPSSSSSVSHTPKSSCSEKLR